MAKAKEMTLEETFAKLEEAIEQLEKEDISLEQTLFEKKTAFFENVFSMKPILKEKRIYKID